MVLLSHPFQSTLPLRGVTPRTSPRSRRRRNFNPHSPCGERLVEDAPCHVVEHDAQDFNPHSPCGERLILYGTLTLSMLFQSTLPLRGATPPTDPRTLRSRISIHTPLAGIDTRARRCRPSSSHFNPHSPCGERRRNWTCSTVTCNFNPHSPCGERLEIPEIWEDLKKFQSTLPLRGATRAGWRFDRCQRVISIHTPLAGSDSTKA